MVPGAQCADCDFSAREFVDCSNALVGNNCIAARVNSGQGDNALTGVEFPEQGRHVVHRQVGVTNSQLIAACIGNLGVFHFSEALRMQQFFGYVLRRKADRGCAGEANLSDLRRCLGRCRQRGSNQCGGAERETLCQEVPPRIAVEFSAHALSSFFSSFRNRQSVPCAMSVFGSDLIIPTSCSRSP